MFEVFDQKVDERPQFWLRVPTWWVDRVDALTFHWQARHCLFQQAKFQLFVVQKAGQIGDAKTRGCCRQQGLPIVHR